jgi:creatinine amidohydrolase
VDTPAAAGHNISATEPGKAPTFEEIPMHGPKLKYRYDHYTWPEIKEVVSRQPVCLLPIGSVEDHGLHLPLDVDNFLIGSICEEAAKRVPDEVLLLPPIPYGFEDHHMSFPGTITIRAEHLESFVLDITLSLAHHGFRKILLVNGHGSNVPFLDVAARNITNHSDAICAMVPWWNLIPKELFDELRESEWPGGMAHACELETSVLLYLRGDLVQIDLAQRDFPEQRSEFFYWDLQKASPVYFQEFFSRYSRTGTLGDPTKASAEKGRRFVDAVADRLVALIQDFRGHTIEPRIDHH